MITLSLCMIVKDEEKVLERILTPMSRVADQIIIVDTGSSDKTREIAGRFTDKIYDFEWKDDFSAARNAVCEKVNTRYWMWLDADDMIDEKNLSKLAELKETLDEKTDMVMMKYLTGFDENGAPTFSYFRERIMKTEKSFRWKGRVHEAIVPDGNVIYSDIEICHKKAGAGDPDRNLRIYEKMLESGERFSPRDKFYYSRELYFHGRFTDAIHSFKEFLLDENAWTENKIEACLDLSECYEAIGDIESAQEEIFHGFLYGPPRAEACFKLGKMKIGKKQYEEAIYWLEQAMRVGSDKIGTAFVRNDCHDFLPAIWLCVCYDKIGDYQKALQYHKISREIKPEDPSVKQNEIYFEGISV